MELWDSSGAEQYSGCWPAIQRDSQGVVFVFNPENQGQVEVVVEVE